MAILARDVVKMWRHVACAVIISIAVFLPTHANAQVAVPVVELEGSPLLVSTVQTTLYANDIAWNSAYLTAKEAGTAMYNGVPVSGAQLLAMQGGGSNPASASADSLANRILKPLIKQFTNSIVAWINNGFQGGPQFVTDPQSFFLSTADRVAGNFIYTDPDLNFLCYPLLKLSLNLGYSKPFKDEIKCTLSQVIDNVDDFTRDFSKGSWPAWFSVTQNQQNNPFGAYVLAENELTKRIASQISTDKMQLEWGKGILSAQDCLQSDYRTGDCLQYGPIKTPGTVINDQLSAALGDGLRQLELADEFDEIVGALIGQLMDQVVMKVGGLRGS